MRTTVASRATMTAMATPSSLMTSMSPVTKPRNTVTIMRAALVTTRPERWRPFSTAASLPSPSSQYSLTRASRKTS